MNRLVGARLGAVTFMAMLQCFSASVQGAGQKPAAAPPGTIHLEPVRQLRKGVDAWPLIAGPSGSAGKRVNALLADSNQRLARALKTCDEGYRNWSKMAGGDAQGQSPASSDWQRTVAITMTGPRFLSMVAVDSVFCGGPHPDSDTVPMVFDLTTGAPVDWNSLISGTAGVSKFSDTVTDGTSVDAWIVPGLREMSISQAEAECKDAFEDRQSFMLWPDAKLGKLVAAPFGMPQAVQVCAEPLHLTFEQARRLGFADLLLAAIEQAHRQYAAAHER